MSTQETVSNQIARLASLDPCIIRGCSLDYGHDGAHELESHPSEIREAWEEENHWRARMFGE